MGVNRASICFLGKYFELIIKIQRLLKKGDGTLQRDKKGKQTVGDKRIKKKKKRFFLKLADKSFKISGMAELKDQKLLVKQTYNILERCLRQSC